LIARDNVLGLALHGAGDDHVVVGVAHGTCNRRKIADDLRDSQEASKTYGSVVGIGVARPESDACQKLVPCLACLRNNFGRKNKRKSPSAER
jgi:hypothetical protein